MYDMGSQCSGLRWSGGEGTEHLGAFHTGHARRFLDHDRPIPPRRSTRAAEKTQVGEPMHPPPGEQDRLLISPAADVARRRRARGLKLNYPEAIAILTADILEWARDGKSVAEI